MAIQLSEYSWPAKVLKSGDDENVSVAIGQHLRVETSPGGEEILDVVCPPGKNWTARVIVEITETDA